MVDNPLRRSFYAAFQLAIVGINAVKRQFQLFGLILLEVLSEPSAQIVPINLSDMGAVCSHLLNAGVDGAAFQGH